MLKWGRNVFSTYNDGEGTERNAAGTILAFMENGAGSKNGAGTLLALTKWGRYRKKCGKYDFSLYEKLGR